MERPFMKLQVTQALLVVVRMFLCFYEIYHRFVNREMFDDKVRRFTGGYIGFDNDLFKIIQVAILCFLVACSATCIYYVVSEDRRGIVCMMILLWANLVLQLYEFDMYSSSLLEIIAVCGLEIVELFGMYFVFRWIWYKNQYCNNEMQRYYVLWYAAKQFERVKREELESATGVQIKPAQTDKKILRRPKRVRYIQNREEESFTTANLIKLLKEHEVTQKIVKCSNIEMMAKRNVERKTKLEQPINL